MKIIRNLFSYESHKAFWISMLIFMKSCMRRQQSKDVLEVDALDWEGLMASWGVSENDRLQLVKQHKRHRWFAIAPCSLILWLLYDQITTQGYPSLWSIWTVFLLSMLAILMFVSSSWRAWVLENQKFQPFSVWIGFSNDEKFD